LSKWGKISSLGNGEYRMITKKKNDAMKFLENLVGELTVRGADYSHVPG